MTIEQGRAACDIVAKSLEAEKSALRARWALVHERIRAAVSGLPDCEHGPLALCGGHLAWYGGGLEPLWHYPESVKACLAAVPGLFSAAKSAGLLRLAEISDALAACDLALHK